jgi:hypothetical protein
MAVQETRFYFVIRIAGLLYLLHVPPEEGDSRYFQRMVTAVRYGMKHS